MYSLTGGYTDEKSSSEETKYKDYMLDSNEYLLGSIRN